MTIPRERSNSIRRAREFLRSLLDPKKTPRVPRAIRREAYWALRHFPADWEINQSAEALPEIWDKLETEDDGQG